jgi:predicted RNase H-like HicB family nuclease
MDTASHQLAERKIMKSQHYTFRVNWSPEDKEHVALCAEFPSLSWLAKTPEAALKGIQKVVADVVADMQASGEYSISIANY